MDKTFAIALSTFRELVRSKILYSVFSFALLLVAISSIFGTVTIGDQVKVIKDFGLMSSSFFSIAFSVISGASLLSKELTKKTVYNILAKPVRRGEFLVGKYFGMLATAVTLMVMMGVALSGFVTLFEGRIDPGIWQALYFSCLELVIICAAAIFFSSIVVTPLLSGIFTFAIFLAGRSAEYLLYFVKEGHMSSPALAGVLKLLSWVLPRFDWLVVSDQVVYGSLVPCSQMFWAFCYAVGYAAILLALSAVIFSRREFN